MLNDVTKSVKPSAFTQHPRLRTSTASQAANGRDGVSVRTDQVRYTEWRDWKTRMSSLANFTTLSKTQPNPQCG